MVSVGADLVRRKKSLPVTAVLTSGTSAGRELVALYRADCLLDACQVAPASELAEKSGGRAWVQRETTARLAGGGHASRRGLLRAEGPRGAARSGETDDANTEENCGGPGDRVDSFVRCR